MFPRPPDVAGPGPQPQRGGQQPSPEEIKSMLKQIVSQARRVAQENNIPWAEIVGEETGHEMPMTPVQPPPLPGGRAPMP